MKLQTFLLASFFCFTQALHSSSFAQFNVPGGVYNSTSGSLEFHHNIVYGGLKLDRLNNTKMTSQIGFLQNGVQRWTFGIDHNETNTNDFFIYGGQAPSFKFVIAPTGKLGLGIDNTNPQHLLHIKGGGIRIEETNDPTLDNDGPGADLVLVDKSGGLLDIYSDNKVAGISLNGGSTTLYLLRYSTDHKVVIGNVTVPTTNNYRLYVEKGILTEKLKIAIKTDGVNWSDFVFEKDYKLLPLSEVETFVKKNKHLPEIPSANEMYKEGLDVAQMDAKLLQKIEELTLYMIELEKNNAKLAKRISDLELSK